MNTLVSKYLITNTLWRKASILQHSSINEVTVSSILLQHINEKRLLSKWTHRLWQKVDTFCLMLFTPHENCVRRICQQIAATMLHCDDCHLVKWHPTVMCVFWDTMLRCHWVSPDIFKESRIPLLGLLKPWQWRHYTHPMTHHISEDLNPQQHGCDNSNLTRYTSLVH
jgi:hypothetical protein